MDENENTSLYQECIARGIPMHSHYSDLYIPYTAETVALVARFKVRAEVFHDTMNGGLWYDVFGAYLPYWESKTKGTR